MAFSLNETTLLSAINSGNIFSIINSVLSPGYGFYLKSGVRALSPSSVLGIEYGADASVVSAPIEKGSYSSFNKVKRPPIIRVLFTLEGWTGFSGSIPNLTNFTLTSRTDMLAALDAMVADTQVYDIETPDTTYEDYDLIRYNYRTSDRDVTLLTVEAIFQSVMQEAEVTLTSTTANSNTTANATSKAASTVTEKANSTATNSTLEDVKGALTGLKESVSSASTTVATSVSNAVSSATSGATSAINGAANPADRSIGQYNFTSGSNCHADGSKLWGGFLDTGIGVADGLILDLGAGSIKQYSSATLPIKIRQGFRCYCINVTSGLNITTTGTPYDGQQITLIVRGSSIASLLFAGVNIDVTGANTTQTKTATVIATYWVAVGKWTLTMTSWTASS